jgi:hypothetical protein
MDPVTLVYYGTVCGLLAVVAPRVSPAVLRVVAGIAVGLVAAGVLPLLRRAFGL